jgi:TRAP-type mannitol/chloroaromatic compound transport system permease small subunit
MINRFIYGVDYLSRAVGYAFAWCIIVLTFGTCYEVFMRYSARAELLPPLQTGWRLAGAALFCGRTPRFARGLPLGDSARPALRAN